MSRRFLVPALALTLLAASPALADRPAPTHGYISTPHGVSLEYILSLPSETVPVDG